VQVADPVVGAEAGDIVAQLARSVRRVNEHPGPVGGGSGSGGDSRDRDERSRRRGDPVDHYQPGARRAGGRIRRRDLVVPCADRERGRYDTRAGQRGVTAERLADRAITVRADHELVAWSQPQRAEHGGHAL
jgi:hypothetical protein